MSIPRLTNSQAQWDLGTLGERKSTGGEQFFSITEQKMLHFTLPLPGKEGQVTAHGTKLKTIQLFFLKPQDFHTAVDYLSQNAGLRHCHLKNVSENLTDAGAGPHSESQPRETSVASAMEPPMGPPVRPRVRPLSQASVFAPARRSPAHFIRRPQTVRPNSTFLTADLTQYPPRPGTAVPFHGRVPPPGHLRQPSLPQVSPATQGSFARDRFSQPQRFPSRKPSVVGAEDRTPLYEHPVRHASVASHAPSPRLMPYDGREPPPSHPQVEMDTHNERRGLYHGRLDDRSESRAVQVSSSSGGTIGMTAPLFEKHPSPRHTPAILQSRSPWVSERGVPIKVQVLEPAEASRYPYTHPKIRWEFVLYLLPSTRIYELCLHAASYIRRECRFVVDGRSFAAQSRDGTIFADQDSLSKEILQGEAILLLERRLSDTAQQVPVNLSGLYSNPSPQGWRPELDKLDASHPTSSEDPSFPAVDELDQVPPPRPLPFPMVGKHGPPRSSSSTLADQSPLAEKPELVNTSIRTRANKQPVQPASQNMGTKTATKKLPNSRQKRPPAVSRRAASSASGSKLDSESAPKQPAKPRNLARRPETSLGIRSKRKELSSDAGVSAEMPTAMDSAQSDAKVSQRGLATAACMGCRNKKRKCDRAKPMCGPCLKDNRPCTYPNIQETAATGSSTDKAYKGHRVETVAHPMGRRSQAVTSLAATSDALTQTSYSWEFRDTATQTQLVEHGQKDVDMLDVGTDPCSLYPDAWTETDRCNDNWFPFSQCAEVMIWASRRSEEQIEKAADVLKITDPSREDYRSKVEQAAVYAVEFEKEIRDKCEEILRRG